MRPVHFAAITCALIVGAYAERMKFSAVLLFMVLWFTFSYLDGDMVWYWDGPDAIKDAATLATVTDQQDGCGPRGALDFAGGTVVHINAGVAGLVAAYVLGKRLGYGRESMAPHNLTLTMVGAALLWVGWFGFNAGSNLEANGTAAMAFANTLFATAAAVLTWIFAEWMIKGSPRSRCRVRRGRGPGGDYAGMRVRRTDWRRDHWCGCRRCVLLGREQSEEDAGRR